MVGPKKHNFGQKSIYSKGIWGAPVRQKFGMILENKVIQKLDFFLQKMVSKFDILK